MGGVREGEDDCSQCSMRHRVPSVRGGTASPNTPSLRAQRSNPESFGGGILDCFATLAMTRGESSASQFAAKQYSSPSPPVLFKSACEQPPSGPREGCELFQDFDGSSSRRPCRSEW